MHPRLTLIFALCAIVAGSAHAQDARERGFIRKGMQEGEVLQRIGPPDHESRVSGPNADVEVKTWTYFPARRDPQTLSIFTLKGGVVVEIDRKISR